MIWSKSPQRYYEIGQDQVYLGPEDSPETVGGRARAGWRGAPAKKSAAAKHSAKVSELSRELLLAAEASARGESFCRIRELLLYLRVFVVFVSFCCTRELLPCS